MKLKLDMHVHSEKSFDSLQSLSDITAACKNKGVDGVCICDHDVARVDFEIKDGILILPGIEISTEYGHLLGLLIEREVKPTRDFAEAVKRIYEAGGVAVLAHPFENRKIPNETLDKRVDEAAKIIDGIEVQNGRAPLFVKRANEYAYVAAKRVGLSEFGGSDAHTPTEVGGVYTEIEVDAQSVDAITLDIIREALKKGRTTAIYKSEPPKSSLVKSQFIRHTKGKSGLKKWLKYLAFTARLYTVGPSKK